MITDKKAAELAKKYFQLGNDGLNKKIHISVVVREQAKISKQLYKCGWQLLNGFNRFVKVI